MAKRATRMKVEERKSVQSLLIAEQLANTHNFEQISDSNRLLMSPSEQKTREIMKNVGWDHSIREVENVTEKEADRSLVKKMFLNDDVYKLSEIEKVAMETGLYLASIEKFKCPSKREKDSASMLRIFVEKNDIEFNKNNFFALSKWKYIDKKVSDFDFGIGVYYFYRPPKSKEDFVYVGNLGGDTISYRDFLNAALMRSLVTRYSFIFLINFFGSSIFMSTLGGGILGSLFWSSLSLIAYIVFFDSKTTHSTNWLKKF